MSTWYVADSAKLTLAECWRCSDSFDAFVALALAKVFNDFVPQGVAHTYISKLHYISAEDLRRKAPLEFEVNADMCRALDFKLQFCYVIPTLGFTRMRNAIYLNSDKRTLSELSWLEVWTGKQLESRVYCACVSYESSKRLIITSSEDTNFNSDLWKAEYLPGHPINRLYQRHQFRLGRNEVEIEQLTEESISARLVEWNNDTLRRGIERKLLTPISEDDADLLRQSFPDETFTDVLPAQPPVAPDSQSPSQNAPHSS